MTSRPYTSRFAFASLTLILATTLSPITVQAQEKRTMTDTLQRIFGIKEKKAGPEDTLIAPFADNKDLKPIQRQNGERPVLPVNDVPLHVPHRSNHEINSWLSQIVMGALELDKEKIQNINTALAPTFTTEALAQFKDFGQKSNVFSSVFYGEGRRLVSYGKSPPTLMRTGPVKIPPSKISTYIDPGKSLSGNPDQDDTVSEILSLKDRKDQNVYLYQWVFQVPATLSLIDNSLSSYDAENTAQNSQTQQDVTFCITVSRSNLNPDDGVMISHWGVGNCDG